MPLPRNLQRSQPEDVELQPEDELQELTRNKSQEFLNQWDTKNGDKKLTDGHLSSTSE